MAKRPHGHHPLSSSIMEVVGGQDNVAHLRRQTCIEHLPKSIIADILNRMPMQDAVRTSVLSRSWRSNWTMRTHLEFDHVLFQYLQKKIHNRFLLVTYAKIISRTLLRHQGAVLKFELCRLEGLNHDEISDWILFLTENGMKEFTLYNLGKVSSLYKLPTQVSFITGMTYLELHNCSFQTTREFGGFPNLKCLVLSNVAFEDITSWKFIACCLNLEILELYEIVLESEAHNLAKLQNLKEFTLHLCHVHLRTAVIDLVHNLTLLPKLEEVDLSCEVFSEKVHTKRWLPDVFKCLRVLRLSLACLTTCDQFFLTFQLICYSPNLQELEISLAPEDPFSDEVSASCWEKFCTIGRLQIVNLASFIGSRNQLRLVKSLLALPLLEKMNICYSQRFGQVSQGEEALRISEEIVKFHRASPEAEINFSYK